MYKMYNNKTRLSDTVAAAVYVWLRDCRGDAVDEVRVDMRVAELKYYPLREYLVDVSKNDSEWLYAFHDMASMLLVSEIMLQCDSK
eukprot:g50455.t1